MATVASIRFVFFFFGILILGNNWQNPWELVGIFQNPPPTLKSVFATSLTKVFEFTSPLILKKKFLKLTYITSLEFPKYNFSKSYFIYAKLNFFKCENSFKKSKFIKLLFGTNSELGVGDFRKMKVIKKKKIYF